MNFLRLFRKNNVPEPTASWAGYEAGLSALLDGRPGDCRNTFLSLQKRLPNPALSSEIGTALSNSLGQWQNLSSFTLAEECPVDTELAMLEFGKALKNWEQGDRQAMSFLKLFAQADFSEQKEWAEPYQVWSHKIVADVKLLNENEPDWENAWTGNEAEEELKRLSSLRSQLKTSGRALFTLQSWEQWFKSLQASEAPKKWEAE